MRTTTIIGILGLICLVGCRGDGKTDLEHKFDRVKLDMSLHDVTAILGTGRQVTPAQIAAAPEYPKLDMTGLPSDTVWYVWDGKLQYVLIGFSNDKAVLAKMTGSAPPKRIGS